MLAFAIAWTVLMCIRLATNATDVPRYFVYGEAMRHGYVPYRDFAVEYPPAALAVFGLPALLASGERGYRIAFEVVMAICSCGVLLLLAAALARLRGRVTVPVAFAGAATIGLGPIALGHYDLWPALLVSGALAALLWERLTTAAILAGLAIAAKLYAAVALPIAAVWLWRRLGRDRAVRWLAVVVATVVVCFLPFLILSPGGTYSSLSGQANRPLQIESSAAAALLAAHQLVSLSLGVGFSHASVNLAGRGASAAAAATVVAEVLLLLYVWVVFARREADSRALVRSSTAAVLVFVLLGKVFSPQFLLWLIPLVPLLGGTLALTGSAAVGAAVILTRAYFPGRWSALIRFEALPTWLLVARDGVLLALLAALLVAEHRRATPM